MPQVRGDLIRILSKLFRRKATLDGIIIETTGLAVSEREGGAAGR